MTRPSGEPLLDRANGRPSGEEAIEFTRQIAALASAGLPLPSGLRALGEELPQGSLRGMLASVADRIDAGESIEDAITSEGARFPATLRGLIAAGVRSGRLAEALGRFLDVNDLGDSLRRQLKFSMIYPIVLLTSSFTIFVLVSVITAQGFASIFDDFGMSVPWITQTLVIASQAVIKSGWWLVFGPLIGITLTWVAMRLTLGAAERQRLIQRLPLIGPLSRDTTLAQFCPVLALLLESDVPLGEALSLAGQSSRDLGMAATTGEMAEDIAQGKTLGESVTDRHPFPRGFGAFLDWAQSHRGLAEALKLSAETFEARARSQAAFLSRFCNTISMVVVLWWVALTVIALFLPMVQLMNALAGSGSPKLGWMDEMSLVGVGVVAALGVGSIFVITWPWLFRGASMAVGGLPGLIHPEDRQRKPFWYYGWLGWMLLCVLVVALPSVRAMNWLGQGHLPDWWLNEIWPETEILGYVIALLAALLIGFSWIVKRTRTLTSENHFLGKKRPREFFRFRLPVWRFGLRHVMFAMAPMALLMVLARDFGWSLLAVIALILPPILIMSAYVVLTDRKVAQHEALLRVMAMAARADRPLGPAISAFAETCRGSYQRKVRMLSLAMEQGATLPQALDLVPRTLSKTGEIVARVGWETGTLKRSLDDAVVAAEAERASRVVASATVGYPLGVLAVIIGIGSFLLLYVGPAFTEIFKDFGVPLPEPSRRIFALFGDNYRTAGIDMATGVFFSMAVSAFVLAISVLLLFLTRRLLAVLPIGAWLTRRRHTAIILRTLAAAIEAGQALPAILTQLAERYPRPWARRRLANAAVRVTRGEDWCESLRREGLMSNGDSAVIHSAERVGNLAWALRETAASGERRLSYRLQAVGQVLQPLLVVAMGGLVLLFAVTYFRPLVRLIDAVAEVSL
ncbi:MAG: type secretory pathway, component PulF [Planctomycetota bacterium]|nr:type secretory pathway, component PulF [Planctomycetota bacterium]